MTIKYIIFECVSRCNMNCKFCFSYWRDGFDEISTEQAKEIITTFKKNGLEAINFTGGEPLLRSDIVELIKFSKELGLTTIISTNGILLKKVIGKISNYIDFIGLPLDSIDSDTHNYMRETKSVNNHQKLIVDLINYIYKNYPNIGIKINTIVSKKNINSIIGLGDMLKGKVVSWKLSHFIPGAYGKLHQKEFEISNSEYLDIVTRCKKINKDMNIISPLAYSQHSGCLVISSDGHLMKPSKNTLIDLGSAFSLDGNKYKDFNEKINTYFFSKLYVKQKK